MAERVQRPIWKPGMEILERFLDESGNLFPDIEILLNAFKEGTARAMATSGQFGDIMSQWHRGFHQDLAEILGAKSDPSGDWGERMFSFQTTLVEEGYLEEDEPGEDGYGYPVQLWKLGPRCS